MYSGVVGAFEFSEIKYYFIGGNNNIILLHDGSMYYIDESEGLCRTLRGFSGDFEVPIYSDYEEYNCVRNKSLYLEKKSIAWWR